MTSTVCLNNNYSTTKLLTKEKPEIISYPEDKFKSVLFLPVGKDRHAEGGLRTQGYFKSYKDKPLISIITVVFNGEKHLEETIQSVINQTYDNVEYIIIDGGSTDGTIDIIKRYADQIDYWVSEKDNGIYDAMNSAMWVCTGDIIAFLNSDDWYNLDTLQYVCDNMEKDYLACGITKIYDNGLKKSFMPQTKNLMNYNKRNGMPFPHPGLFVRSYVFCNIGLFNLKYKIAADMDFVYRMLDSRYAGNISNKSVTNFRYGGESSNLAVIFESRKIEYKAGASMFSVVYSFTWRIILVLAKRFYFYFLK